MSSYRCFVCPNNRRSNACQVHQIWDDDDEVVMESSVGQQILRFFLASQCRVDFIACSTFNHGFLVDQRGSVYEEIHLSSSTQEQWEVLPVNASTNRILARIKRLDRVFIAECNLESEGLETSNSDRSLPGMNAVSLYYPDLIRCK